jgi:hypothetical protein
MTGPLSAPPAHVAGNVTGSATKPAATPSVGLKKCVD